MDLPLGHHIFDEDLRGRLDTALAGVSIDLNPGLSEEAIADITAPLRGPLHYPLVWLYQWHNGSASAPHMISPHLVWPPLEDAVAALLAQREQEMQGYSDRDSQEAQDALEEVDEMWPLHHLWLFSIPEMRGCAVADLSVMSPQVPLWFHAPGHPRHGALIAPSLADALNSLCEGFEQKEYRWQADRGGWTSLRSVNTPGFFGF